MTKNELIVDIIRLNVMIGITNKDEFVNYITMVLPMMSTSDLRAELESLECNV